MRISLTGMYISARQTAPVIKTMRPVQWTKNLVIFAGVIFSGKLFAGGYLLKTLSAFAVFCLLSGSVYIINDLADMAEDRSHPEKMTRPLASGLLSTGPAAMAAGITAVTAIAGAFLLNTGLGFLAVNYFAITLGYSLYLKNIAIIDVLIIATGFVIRAAAGAVVISVGISPWLLICAFLLALFLALAKRRHELLYGDVTRLCRGSLYHYTPRMLDGLIHAAAVATVTGYSLYTVSQDHSVYLVTTVPMVVFGVFRYRHLVYHRRLGGTPETALPGDRPLFLTVLCWVITSIIIVYM